MNKCYFGDALELLPQLAADGFKAQTCITSPPYFGLRDYGHEGQIGLEETPQEYIDKLVRVFRGVWNLLADDGTLWLNLGDSYNSGSSGGLGGSRLEGSEETQRIRRKAPFKGDLNLKHKDLIGIPWRVAFALQADGWYLRQDIIWHKPNPMPESVRDRCTKAHEYLFMLTKSTRYYYDQEAIKEKQTHDSVARLDRADHRDKEGWSEAYFGNPPTGFKRNRDDKQRGHSRRHAGFNGRWDSMSKAEQQALGRNKRSVWEVATRPYSEAHFAVFPPALIEPCVLASSKTGDVVMDPFFGSGTTGEVAQRLGRKWVGIEINRAYEKMQRERTKHLALSL